jgi:hypothetical protein
LLVFVTFLTSCTCIDSKIPVEGRLGPYEIKTTVDSEFARYYVENYLGGKKTNPELDARLDSLNERFKGRVPQQRDLKAIAQDFSMDFAALFWGQHMLDRPENISIQEIFLRNLNNPSQPLETSLVDYKVLLVPGLDYKENGHATGSDLQTQRTLFAKLGAEVVFIEIPSLGTVEENSVIVAEAINKHSEKKILLSGPSSAGPAIHLALAAKLSIKESSHVAVWLNLGGVINGSPALDWVGSGITYPVWQTILWFKGWNAETFESLRADVSRQRAAHLKIPEHIKVINYIGLSLSGNISKFAADKYCIMRSDGPNDGLGLLSEMVVPDSQTIIATTSDHFFAEDPQIKEKSVALLKTVMQVVR